jgi:ribosomal protein S6
MTDTTETMNERKDALKLYEVGFHIIPSLSEEQIAQEVADIKAIIEKAGGTIASEGAPKLHPLAYEIAKVTAGVKRNHDRSYFGFVKFDCTGEEAVTIKEALDKKDTLIRFVLIKTVKENTLYGTKTATRGDSIRSPKKSKEDEEKEGVASPITAAELDKTIDDLVIE